MIVLNQVEKRKAVEIEGYKHKNTPEQVVSARVQTARRGGGQWEGGGEQGDSWNFEERTEAGGDEQWGDPSSGEIKSVILEPANIISTRNWSGNKLCYVLI